MLLLLIWANLLFNQIFLLVRFSISLWQNYCNDVTAMQSLDLTENYSNNSYLF